MRVLLGLALCSFAAYQPGPVRVTVRLLDVRAAKGGVLHVGLHGEPGLSFPGPSPTTNLDASPRDNETILTFEVPRGSYAVAAFHDENSNGKLDANFLGVPREGYGVSNDVRPRFRAPRFSEARVLVSRDTTLVVHMAY
jgi:uncharacterized protein (DUF2141 family)